MLILMAGYSYFSPAAVRWTHREPLTDQQIMDAPPGRPVAETWEIGVIQGRVRWMRNDWLATPHVATGKIVGVAEHTGLSISLRDRLGMPVDQGDLDWHFLGFGAGHPVFFREDETSDVEAEGLWEINSAEICVPLWALVVLCLIPLIPVVWQRRPRNGVYCRYCGYDLRATPERCPECGRMAEKISSILK